jgi:DNA-binding transcriptional regulator YhcF (GntR family)
VEEWRVASYINPKNSIRQIANTTKMNDLEIRKIVYGLLQAGLVEMVRQEGVEVRPKQIGLPTTDADEQKSLVNRLITRIRSI